MFHRFPGAVSQNALSGLQRLRNNPGRSAARARPALHRQARLFSNVSLRIAVAGGLLPERLSNPAGSQET
ncbi:MAG: hypothetical protein FWD12_12960, partial [Alphaproteobacteria bacterium]|nr:hypothetical protein [Alphaproteobacteria bacterium]